MTDERALHLLHRAAEMLGSFSSPDGNHRALRSIYSSRGVCETSRGGHSPLCVAWVDLQVEIAEYLTEHAAPAPSQPRLLDLEAV